MSLADSHICDPEGLLSRMGAELMDKQLARFAASMGPQACPDAGYQVYIALFRGLDDQYMGQFATTGEALEVFASSWGLRTRVLGNPCRNGAVLVYSARDSAMLSVSDDGLLVPMTLVGNSMSTIEALTKAVEQIELELFKPTFQNMALNEFRVQPSRIALTVVAACLGLAWTLLSVCCVYDTLLHWRHRHHWSICVQKIQRVHNVFTSGSGDIHLCPMCVEFVPDDNTQNKVKQAMVMQFLCGHRFHSECLQTYFRANPKQQGRCPICELPHSFSCHSHPHHEPNDREACRSVNAIDEIKSFFLASLKRQYPEIITDLNVSHWNTTHTEIWLSELECPRYLSIFNNIRK